MREKYRPKMTLFKADFDPKMRPIFPQKGSFLIRKTALKREQKVPPKAGEFLLKTGRKFLQKVRIKEEKRKQKSPETGLFRFRLMRVYLLAGESLGPLLVFKKGLISLRCLAGSPDFGPPLHAF